MIKIKSSEKLTARKFFCLFFRNGNFFALLGAVAFAFSASQAHAAVITVNNLNDAGPGSLRQAILDANASAGVADQIQVNAGLGTINLVTPLPVITDTVTIINLNTGSGRVELNGLATQNGPMPSIGFDIQAATCEIRGFAVNRFGDAGIRVGVGGNNTIIHQNYVGTDINGTSKNCPDAANPCGNINRGIWVNGATGVQIGTSGGFGLPNTIAGNFGRGISISSAMVGTTVFNGSAIVQNNYIGTGSGNNDLGNSEDGILIAGASGSQIGGAAPISNDSNVIIGNGGSGISIIADVNYPASNNIIQGNYIGYTLGTNQAIGNDRSGIVIQGADNTVGGTTPDARNIIVGNKSNGISINSSLATGNLVQGNYIGTGDGINALGNNTNGIQISNLASGNSIGGTTGTTLGATPSCTGACNIIANNGVATSQTAKAGLYLDPTAGVSNSIRANSIFNNGGATGIGIDLAGVLANGTSNPNAPVGKNTDDAGDADTGPNNLQNSPVISNAYSNGFIQGTINSAPNTVLVIDFYRNDATDTAAGSEGRTYIGSTSVTTDASGNATIGFTSTVPLTAMPSAQFITATATTTRSVFLVGDTSELSAPVAVQPGIPTAASATISGRVVKSNGVGFSEVSVRLFDTASGQTFYAITDETGNYQFANVPVGQDYIIMPLSYGYTFNPSSRFISLLEDLNVSTFTAFRKKTFGR